jgi:hypothetical protein
MIFGKVEFMRTESFFSTSNKASVVKVVQALFLIILVLTQKANPMAIVFVYVFETVVIGVINAVKLLYLSIYNPDKNSADYWLHFLTIPFFVLHFGGFVAIQTIFIYTGFAIYDDNLSTSLSWKNYQAIFEMDGFLWVFVSVVITNFFSFYNAFLKPKKYKQPDVAMYFIKPYIRIFVQQFLAIVPFLFLVFTNKVGMIAAILLVLMRTFVDFYFQQFSNNPIAIKKLALKIMNKDNPNELPKIEKSLQVFFEE